MGEKESTPENLHISSNKEQKNNITIRRHFDESRTFKELFIELIKTHK